MSVPTLRVVDADLTDINEHLKTTGAKIFSSHGGAPTDRPLLDTEAELYDIQKAQKPPTARFGTVSSYIQSIIIRSSVSATD